MSTLMENLKKLFNVSANPDIISQTPPPAPAAPATPAASPAPAAAAPAAAKATIPAASNPGTDFANTQYVAVNFQYGEEDKTWAKKIGIYKKGVGTRWYQLVEVE
ncbi:MAG: hypothetical protein ACO4AJ_16450 [Prochlorothrix sp.]